MSKKIKIGLFPKKTSKDIVLTTNGIALDLICTKAETDENITNGNYVVDFTFVLDDDKLYEKIEEESILKCLMDYGDEIFTVTKIQKTTRYLNVTARQITIDECLALHLEDVRPTSTGGQGAMTSLLAGADGTKNITLTSDISTIGTSYYQDKSLYQALWDSDNSFINIWGGETLRRGYNVTINKNIGIDRNVVIAEKRNLTGFNCDTNIDDVITRSRGKGYNDIKGNWVNSPLVDNYARVKTKTYEYKVRVREAGQADEEGYIYFDTLEEAQAELDRLAALEFSNNNVDKIQASYDISFVQLEQTEEYKDYIAAERTYIGDTLRVYIPRLDVDIKVEVIERKYDILAQKVKEVTLSNYPKPTALSIADIGKAIVNANYTQQALFEQAKIFSSDLLKSGLKNSFVVVRTDEILIMDTKDINTATKVWRFNNNGLGFSSTSYYGTYGTAITSDGKIVADMITTGILSAITIKNLDGSFQIDLSGTGGCNFFNNGKLAVGIKNNSINLYNILSANSDQIGAVSSNMDKSGMVPIIDFYHKPNSGLAIGYEDSSGTKHAYIMCDKYNLFYKNITDPIFIDELVGINAGLNMHSDIFMNNFKIYLNADKTKYIAVMADGSMKVEGDITVHGNVKYTGSLQQVTITG